MAEQEGSREQRKPRRTRRQGQNLPAHAVEAVKDAWIAVYRRDGWVAACNATGIEQSLPTYWKHHDPAFREAFEEAQPAVADRLERIAEQAIDGRLKLDRSAMTLLIFRLKALRPAMYRERVSLEHTGAGGGAIKVEHGDAGRGAALLAEWGGRLKAPTAN